MNPDMYGCDLTFKSVERDIRKKEDVLVAFIHWFLTKRGFRCIGIGDMKQINGNEIGSELLPPNWNSNENYTLRYLLHNELYILHCVLSDDRNLLFNLMKASDLTVSNVAIHNIDKTVIALSGGIEKMIPTYKDLLQIILRDLVEGFFIRATKSSETQTPVIEPSTNQQQTPLLPLAINPQRESLRRPPRAGLDPDWNSRNPFRIGRSDLNPLGRGGSGMLFNPFEYNSPLNPGSGVPGGLPRGSVPPGARFDPIGPSAMGPSRRRTPPDADHLPPPGYNDMFM